MDRRRFGFAFSCLSAAAVSVKVVANKLSYDIMDYDELIAWRLGVHHQQVSEGNLDIAVGQTRRRAACCK